MGFLWNLISENWAVIMTAPGLFFAAVAVGWLAGWIVIRLVYNQRLAHQGDMITNLRAVLEEKLPASFLPPPPRKRSKQMSFGLVLIFVGVGAAFVGALLLALDKSSQPTKTATVIAPIVPPVIGPALQNPIAPTSPVRPTQNFPKTVQSLSEDERNALARDLYSLKTLIPIIYLTESGVPGPSHSRADFVQIFQKAGIQPGTTGQEVEGPDQTGLLLCVPDVNSIPEKVRRLAEVLQKYGIETAYAPLVQSRISSTVPPEVGFVLFVGPR